MSETSILWTCAKCGEVFGPETAEKAVAAKDARIASLTALLKEAVGYVQDRIESGYSDELRRADLRRARSLAERISKEIGDAAL